MQSTPPPLPEPGLDGLIALEDGPRVLPSTAQAIRTADWVRAQCPVGTERTITIHAPHSSAFSVYATVVEHGSGGLILGIHPNLLSVPYAHVESAR